MVQPRRSRRAGGSARRIAADDDDDDDMGRAPVPGQAAMINAAVARAADDDEDDEGVAEDELFGNANVQSNAPPVVPQQGSRIPSWVVALVGLYIIEPFSNTPLI